MFDSVKVYYYGKEIEGIESSEWKQAVELSYELVKTLIKLKRNKETGVFISYQKDFLNVLDNKEPVYINGKIDKVTYVIQLTKVKPRYFKYLAIRGKQ